LNYTMPPIPALSRIEVPYQFLYTYFNDGFVEIKIQIFKIFWYGSYLTKLKLKGVMLLRAN
jgi:hypothetical protein